MRVLVPKNAKKRKHETDSEVRHAFYSLHSSICYRTKRCCARPSKEFRRHLALN